MTIKQIAFLGDSLTQGTEGHISIAEGHKGGHVELVAEMLANLPTIGPLISSGIRGVWLGITGASSLDGEWTFAGSWTTTLTTDAFDKAPKSRWGNGSGVTATYTRPVWYRTPVGFAYYYVDLAGGGDWQYRVDGGTYTNMGQSLLGDNKLKKFYVSGTFSTVDMKCHNGTSAVNALPVGIELFYAAPSSTTGLIVHNLAVDGQKLDEILGSSAGDRLAFLDNVTLGTGSPIANTPSTLIVAMYGRDIVNANTSLWATDLTTFYNRAVTTAPVLLVNPNQLRDLAIEPGGTSPGFPTADQASYRAQTKTTGGSLGATVFDIYDQRLTGGLDTWAKELAASLVVTTAADNGHPSEAGAADVANRDYWTIRKILGIGNVPTSYPVTATRAAVAYAAKRTAVAYTGGLTVRPAA